VVKAVFEVTAEYTTMSPMSPRPEAYKSAVELFSKYSNLRDHDTVRRTDRQPTVT